MANPEKGEVTFKVGKRTYTLKPSMNVMCEYEGRKGKTFAQLLEGTSRDSMVDARDLLWVLLQKHHAKEFPSVDQVGDLIDAAGGIEAFTKAITETARLNAPPRGEGQGKRPQKAQAGTGDASTATPAASA